MLLVRLHAHFSFCATLVAGVAISTQWLRADVFELKDGRRVSGAARDYDQGKAFLVEIDEGVVVVLPKNEIKRHDRESELHKQYAARLKSLPQTVEAHNALAAWCAKVGLKQHALAHYQRLLDFEPNHEVARAALGYQRDKANEWARVVDVMTAEQGKVREGGRFRFPELIAAEKAEREFEVASKTRRKEIRRWQQEALGQGPRAAESLAKLRQINDELAILALSELLLSPIAGDKPLKGLYLQLLRQFKKPATAKTLAEASMHDGDASLRDACYDALLEFGKPIAVATYKAYLLNDDPELINRAAEGLAAMHDSSAVLPLIEALETNHNRKTNPGPQMNVGSTNGNGGISMGGGPKNVVLSSHNQRVLGALSQLTGVNFQFDEKAWLAWYASKYGAPIADLRRDP